MDPNVQVAIATVIGTAITTFGIVVVALINSRRTKDDDAKPKDHSELLELVQSLIRENARKESIIVRLQRENAELKGLIPEGNTT